MSPRTEEQLIKHKAEKRKVITQAALKLFSEEGFQSTSISKIAKEAGVSKGLIYTYFESKEELLRFLILDTIDEMFGIAEVSLGINPTDESFEKMISDYFDWVQINRAFLQIYFGILMQPSVMKLFEKEIMAKAYNVFERMSVYFKNKGFEDPLSETRFFISILDGIYMNYIMDSENYPLAKAKSRILTMYLK
ncbi:TetR/AcrR family transcriptional regulator [Plebeiibacterium sediminum]|uniref:TetR/AcrR family transcriptional regulator n=1 Tax=Plebeiibacterium sediminum TaxID=2992112 RepID=A0AAE3SET6_9BACT|nr:TetR/AcrR family transcriptional regulator [Plebeiobacterium sediminum]MCW3786735.1 TetR/AcrR family transcriptional regulator [Plebeiobacterium sediminum]